MVHFDEVVIVAREDKIVVVVVLDFAPRAKETH